MGAEVISLAATISSIETSDLSSLVKRTDESYDTSFLDGNSSRVLMGVNPAKDILDSLESGVFNDGLKIGFKNVQRYKPIDGTIVPVFPDTVLYFRPNENELEDLLFAHHPTDKGIYTDPYFGNVPLTSGYSSDSQQAALKQFCSGDSSDYLIELSQQVNLLLRIVNIKEKMQIQFSYHGAGEAVPVDTDGGDGNGGTDTDYKPSPELTDFLDKYEIDGKHKIDDVAKYIASCEGVGFTTGKVSNRINHLAGLLSTLPQWKGEYDSVLKKVSGRLLYTMLLPDDKFKTWRKYANFSFEELEKVNSEICTKLVGKYDENEPRSVFELAGYIGMATNPLSVFFSSSRFNFSKDSESRFEMGLTDKLGGHVNLGRLTEYVSGMTSKKAHFKELVAVLGYMGCPTKFGGST